jgi:prepilin signal peptidase PulO-like enzyme (type II secretory pathway)
MRRRRWRSRGLRWGWAVVGLIVIATSLAFARWYDADSFGERGAAYARQAAWIEAAFEIFAIAWAFIFGGSIASFLNVVAYRLPAGLPITGSSFCPHCQVPIRLCDNLPVLGWLKLGGRCRACHLPISIRYPLFEAIGGGMMVLVMVVTIMGHGWNLPGPWDRQTAYGLNLDFQWMDPRLLWSAGLQAGLLMFLFSVTLLEANGGRYPAPVWGGAMIAGIGLLFWKPDLYLVGWNGLGGMVGDSEADGPKPWSPSVNALLSMGWGAIIGWLVGIGQAWVQGWPSRSRWMSWCLVGIVLGWQACLLLAAITSLGQGLLGWALPRFWRSQRVYWEGLWLWVLLLLMSWRWMAAGMEGIDPTIRFFLYGLFGMGSMLIFRIGNVITKDSASVDQLLSNQVRR